MAQVLNYHDAVVYDTDVELFREGGWLNDNCINWFFRYKSRVLLRQQLILYPFYCTVSPQI